MKVRLNGSCFGRHLSAIGGGLLVVFLLLVAAYVYVHGSGNYHEVEKGILYRSSWLGAERLERAVSENSIKTVLNLCGDQPGETWYEGERIVAARHGLKFISLGLSANDVPDSAQISRLIEILRDAPKPLLIHCRAGSDRTGLACALYLAARGGTLREAHEQLSLYYGHFPFLGSKSVAMDVALERFYPSVANRKVVSQAEVR